MANVLGGSIGIIDISVIVIYFGSVFIIGIIASCKSKRGSLSGYFLAGREMNWVLVGASLFASNVGSMHFVGLAGSGAAAGIAVAIFEITAVFYILLLGWIFVPVYVSSKVYTMPEYLEKRFNSKRIQIYLSVLALLLYIFTKISADLFAGSIFIKQAMGWNIYSAIILLLVIAALFSILGGLSAVIWTDLLQTILMIIGAFVLMILSFNKVGGYSAVMEKFLHSNSNSTHPNQSDCAKIPSDSLHLFRNIHTSDFPWTGMTIGLFVASMWYWCSDQVIVQRMLAAKNLSHAKGGCLLAGYLKLLPMFMMVFPGMIARILFPDEIGCSNPESCKEVCGNEAGCTNIAYPLLVIRTMPTGFTGVMLAVMMAALMSSLTSIFNSSSTIFTMDIWKQFRKSPSDIELLVVGRLFIVIIVLLSILWIPVIEISLGSQLFVYTQSISCYLCPPICAVYLLAIFWKRTNEFGAFWSMVIGMVIGLTRFIVEFSFPMPSCGSDSEDNRSYFIELTVDKIHYLHFGAILFAVCLLSAVTLSYCKESMDDKHINGLTFWTKHISRVNDVLEFQCKPISVKKLSTTIIDPSDFKNDHAKINKTSLVSEQLIIPLWKKVMNYILGISNLKSNSEQDQPIRRFSLLDDTACLIEKPFWKHFCNVNAISLIIIVIFILCFYA